MDGLNRTSETELDFALLDGCKIALVITRNQRRIVFRGVAALQRDDELGKILVLTPESAHPGEPRLIISEQNWSGRIAPDVEFDCEFCAVP